MVILRRRMPHKTGMLAVGPYRFISYTNNSGLIAAVKDKSGTMQKVLSSHLIPCLSTPEQVYIDELPVDITHKDARGRSMGEASPIKPLEPFVVVPSPSGYPAAPAGGAEWSLSSIILSDSNDEQLLSTV